MTCKAIITMRGDNWRVTLGGFESPSGACDAAVQWVDEFLPSSGAVIRLEGE